MSFESECLNAHNEFRAQHGVPPLIFSEKLSFDAKRFAQQLLKEGKLRSSDNQQLGENIYCVSSSNPNHTINGDVAVKHWYQKEAEHDYSREPIDTTLPTGNFTQVVWKESRELAIGVASQGGKTIVVTRYAPAGNVRGRFCENVLAPVSRAGSPQVVCTKAPSKPSSCFLPPPTSTPHSASLQSGDFNQDCLNQHNMYRAKHGVPRLELDAALCRYSQEWADKLAQLGKMQHRTQDTYGENIYSAWSSAPNYSIDGGKAVDAWYDEIKFYTFGREPSDLKAGHFTQVVWRTSEKLGVGISKKDGHIYVVCNYSPPGNYVGDYTANVPAPLPGGCSQAPQKPLTCSLPPSVTNIPTSNHAASSGGFNQNCLDQHNMYRAKHGVPRLVLDAALCRYSQEWADKLAQLGKMQHRTQDTYGENIYSAWSSDPNYSVGGGKAVDAWYDEIKFYTFGLEPSDLKAGHFTQVVWRTSEKLGVGISKKNGHIYVVCNYSPPGNYVGDYTPNVPAPL